MLKNYILGAFSILAGLYLLCFAVIYPTQIVLWEKYFLLSLSVFTGVIIVAVHFLSLDQMKNLVMPFMIINFVIFAPLAVSLLVFGLETASFWFIAFPLFFYTVFLQQKNKFLLCYSCIVFLLLILGLVLRYLLYHNEPVVNDQNIVWANILNVFAIFLFTVYSIYYMNLFYRQKIEHLESIIALKNNDETQNLLEVDYDEQKKFDTIYEKIVEYMENSRPYIDCHFMITKISNELNINTTYISKALSLQKNMNFNNFVNFYRIKHAKKMIQDNLEYTLEYIYLSSGFQNQSSFNRTFKTVEGITPSEYRSQFLTKKITKSQI